MRATWLTDVHLNFLEQDAVDAFVARVAAEAPDVLLVTGDTGEAPDVAHYLQALAAVAPVYAVLGNHDYYRSSIAKVRSELRATGRWLPALGPIALTAATTLVGVDGWGDARCGDLASRVRLADWTWIADFAGSSGADKNAKLQALGTAEADALRAQLDAIADAPRELLVLTHVPPFPDACWYNGARSSPDFLPWFTCVAVGEVLRAYAAAHANTTVTVLCGHTHGRGEYRAEPNLLVRTGGWAPGKSSYENPIVQETWSIA